MTLLGSIKRSVNALLARHGHIVATESTVPSFDRFVSLLRRANLMPRTVIDIGVAYGTPWLYKAFPDARYHLVDPTRESLPYMQSWAKKLDAEIHNIALGTESCSMQIATRSTIIHATLLRDITMPPVEYEYDVPVQRFDKLFLSLERPALCKIDVEGAESLVLQGMGERIHELDAIIVELSTITLYERGPEFADIMGYMANHRFSFFEICGVTRRPFDGALHQIDAVFVPKQSPLRPRRWD
jgi:FkbM family methyltransferase